MWPCSPHCGPPQKCSLMCYANAKLKFLHTHNSGSFSTNSSRGSVGSCSAAEVLGVLDAEGFLSH